MRQKPGKLKFAAALIWRGVNRLERREILEGETSSIEEGKR